MHARVWQLRIQSGKMEEFQESLRSVSLLARKQPGYRGFLALTDGPSDAGETTVIAMWESLQAIRDSERNLFLTQALARLMCCTDGLPHIVERPVLANDFRGVRA